MGTTKTRQEKIAFMKEAMKLTNEHKLYLEFAIGCALKVLPIFEKKYPDDKRPLKAIEAARNFFLKQTEKNRKAATATAAYATAAAAYAATDAAAYAAYAAAYATATAAYATDAAAYAAYAAAYAAYAAAYATYAATERKWQVGFLAYLNFKYSLSIKIRGVE